MLVLSAATKAAPSKLTLETKTTENLEFLHIKGNALINAEGDSAAHLSGAFVAGVQVISFPGVMFQVCTGVDNTGMVLVVLTQTQLVFLLPHWQGGWGCVAGDTAGTGYPK